MAAVYKAALGALATLGPAAPTPDVTKTAKQGVTPQGAFTDVGLHTGGERRECGLALVCAVVHTVLVAHAPEPLPHAPLEEVRHLLAEFCLWHLQLQLGQLPGAGDPRRQHLLNSCMLTLQGVCQACEGLASVMDLGPLATRCEAARQALDAFDTSTGDAAVAGALLPAPAELDALLKDWVALPSPVVRKEPMEVVGGVGTSAAAVVDRNLQGA